ncbi:MAG TPA: pseudouridine synthase [Pyrinomonadaceae bacterium]|nr:pseudouridine synthase [Pyrinomonadaceae bacterium]
MQQRLQKLIASAGIASRRHAEDLIVARHVTVNGEVIVELGAKADPETDHIKVKGRLINPLLSQQKPVYVLLHKPKGYLTSMSDPEGRPLVIDLIPSSLGRLHPVGRLDFNTEGLLLLTNDGDFTRHITAAKSHIPKVYLAKVKGMPPDKAVERLRRGIAIGDERAARADVRMLRESKTNAWFEVTLHEGRNQQVRRMFDAIGHSVIKLVRTRIGNLEKKNLKPGRWRKLNEREVKTLKAPHQTRTAAKRNTQSKTKQQQTRTTTRRRRAGGNRV